MIIKEKREYRLENIKYGQGHYLLLFNLKDAKEVAKVKANETGDVWIYQLWQPKRGPPCLARPNMMGGWSKQKIIQYYKKQGLDVRKYGGVRMKKCVKCKKIEPLNKDGLCSDCNPNLIKFKNPFIHLKHWQDQLKSD